MPLALFTLVICGISFHIYALASLDHDPPICFLHSWDDRHVSPHQLLVEMGSEELFAWAGWIQTAILLISTSLVARTTSWSYCYVWFPGSYPHPLPQFLADLVSSPLGRLSRFSLCSELCATVLVCVGVLQETHPSHSRWWPQETFSSDNSVGIHKALCIYYLKLLHPFHTQTAMLPLPFCT
jgi:hypothetical protein